MVQASKAGDVCTGGERACPNCWLALCWVFWMTPDIPSWRSDLGRNQSACEVSLCSVHGARHLQPVLLSNHHLRRWETKGSKKLIENKGRKSGWSRHFSLEIYQSVGSPVGESLMGKPFTERMYRARHGGMQGRGRCEGEGTYFRNREENSSQMRNRVP